MLVRCLLFVSLQAATSWCMIKMNTIPSLDQTCKEIVQNLITLIQAKSLINKLPGDASFFTHYQETPAAYKEMEIFFTHADLAIIAHYQPYFPTLLRKAPKIALILLNTLTTRADNNLRKCLIDALVSYASMNYQDEIPGFRDSIAQKLLSLALPMAERKHLLTTMHTIFSAADNIGGLELLWVALRREDDATLLIESVMSYYKTPTKPDFSQGSILFDTWLSEVISYALVNTTISRERIIRSVEEATTTNFIHYINTEIIDSVRDNVIFNEQMSFARRAKFLDQKMVNLIDEDNIIAYYCRLEKEIPDCTFVAYVESFFNACNKNASSYETCIAKKQLLLMHLKHGLPPVLPKFVVKYAGELPNFGSTEHEDTPHCRLIASEKLSQPYCDGQGFVYGLSVLNKKQYYHVFCAVDEESLDLVWQVRCASETTPVYALYKSYIYLAYDNEISVLNKFTGEKIVCFALQHQLPIVHLQITPLGRLWIVQHDIKNRSLYSYVDSGSRKVVTVETPHSTHSLQHLYFTVDNKLGYYHDGAMTLIEENNSTHSFKINFGTHPTWCHNPAFATHGKRIYYTHKKKDNSCHFVCYDAQEKKELWSLPTGEIAQVCIAADGTLYVGTNDYLMALQPDGKMLWQTPLPLTNYLQFDPLALSPDNRYLSLQYMYGHAYSVNLADGSMQEIYAPQKEAHRRHKLIGVTNKKVTFTTCDY